MTTPEPPSEPWNTDQPVDEMAVLRIFFGICQTWNLSVAHQQALLGVNPDTFARWARGEVSAPLAAETRERIGYVFRIFEALQQLIPTPQAADAWVQTANQAPLFGGKTALQIMLLPETENLSRVCAYLEAQLSGDFS